MEKSDEKQDFAANLREIEQQARLILDEMAAVPGIHRARLLHIITLAQQLEATLTS
jgi:hypothetical protein